MKGTAEVEKFAIGFAEAAEEQLSRERKVMTNLSDYLISEGNEAIRGVKRRA